MTGGLGNKKASGDHSNYSIVEIGPEYWEESWRIEVTCCDSNSIERPSENADVKKKNLSNNNNNISKQE